MWVEVLPIHTQCVCACYFSQYIERVAMTVVHEEVNACISEVLP